MSERTKNDPSSRAVLILGVALLLSLGVIGAGWLLEIPGPVPDVLIVTAGGSMTGLLGLLAPRPTLLGGAPHDPEHRA